MEKFDPTNYYFHGLQYFKNSFFKDIIIQRLSNILKSGYILSRKKQFSTLKIQYLYNNNWNGNKYISICKKLKEEEITEQENYAYYCYVNNEKVFSIALAISPEIESKLIFRKGIYRRMLGEYQVFNKIPISYIKAVTISCNHIISECDHLIPQSRNYSILTSEIQKILKIYNADIPLININDGLIMPNIEKSNKSIQKVLKQY